MWLGFGSWAIGFMFGYATGLSKTPGTVWKVLGVLAGLIGGIAAWISLADEGGIVLTFLGFGFSVGISVGAKLRRKGLWDVMDPGWSRRMREEASTWEVALVQTLQIGVPLGLLGILIVKFLG